MKNSLFATSPLQNKSSSGVYFLSFIFKQREFIAV
jgi:hypothetical protein